MMSDGSGTGRPNVWQQSLRRPGTPPASTLPLTGGPELVVSDQPDVDPFADPREYEPVRSILGRSHDAYFLADDGMSFLRPWAYYQGAEGLPGQRGLILHWPGLRVEVTGENLQAVHLRLMTRRADIWRVFDPARHDTPAPGSPVIRSIRLVLEGEEAA